MVFLLRPIPHLTHVRQLIGPGAEHIYLSLSNRYHPTRKKVTEHPYPGTNDTLLFTSRDGVYWHQTVTDAWFQGDLNMQNWSERNHYVITGMITSQEEHLFYLNECYRSPSARIRKVTLPKHRFVSLHAGEQEAEVMTKVLDFPAGELHLNFQTSAVGYIKISVVDAEGYPIEGYQFEEAEEKFGNSLSEIYSWNQRKLSELAHQDVRLVIRMRNARLFAFTIK